jgi:phage gpG-like protein
VANRPTTFSQRSRARSSAEKAAFHHLTGAGKSRITREFFALTDRDETAIVATVGRHLDLIIKQSSPVSAL